MAALDLMLKSLIASREFNEQSNKNWEAICRLIPGTNVKQCSKRYEELMQQNISSGNSSLSRPGSHLSLSKSSRTEDSQESRSRPNSAKQKGQKGEKDSGRSDGKRPSSSDQSGFWRHIQRSKSNPTMVIHVCDEAKNLKQDFQCPRDLLIKEMKYFAEYLSTDAQRWEEVDISVHCDVQIFDWLMNYTKRTMTNQKDSPKLEPGNVISILISSDFLKMDNLVQECIEYCHDNMSAIIATPCNMNCINDRLVTRIADLFTHNEADEIKDRKDKFKSKIFGKKVERLFDVDSSSPDSPENASTLYRCSSCKRMITKSIEEKIKCLQSRMSIDNKGHLVYSHQREANWDINDFLIDLKSDLKYWRDVYWRVWGHVNYLQCSRCKDTFPCAELGHCKYHPEQPHYEEGETAGVVKPVGMYPCCGQKALRFDPTQSNQNPDSSMWGCRVRDHIVCLDSANNDPLITKVYDDLLEHRDMICIPHYRMVSNSDQDGELNIFTADENACGVNQPTYSKSKTRASSSVGERTEMRPAPRLQALTVEREYDDEFGVGESDDEVGDEEESKPRKKLASRRSRITVDPNAILLDAPDFSTTKQRKWDSSRSMRWNQDAQREEDQRRMNEIVAYLTQLRFNAEKLDKLKQKEYAGGSFAKIEAQWRAANMPPPKAPATLQIRNKPRLTQVQIKGGGGSVL